MELKLKQILSQRMKAERYSLKDVSDATGVPKSTLQEWLNGRQPQNPSQLKKVAEFLDVSFNYLCFGEEDSKQPFSINSLLRDEVFSGVFEINIKRVRGAKGSKN